MPPFENVEAYLTALPGPSREAVERLRATVLAELPGAQERISYGIPAFFVDDHVAMYVAGRGTLKFPLSAPLPLDLVAWTARLHLTRIRGTAASSA